MSEYFDFSPEDDESAVPGHSAHDAAATTPTGEVPPTWPTADPTFGGTFRGEPDTATLGATPPAAPTPPRRHRVLLGAGVALLAVALVAGAAGYALGDRSQPASTRLPNGFSIPSNPFGLGAPSGSSGGTFQFPSFGVPGGVSTATTVPKAVKSSESALVDVDSTIDQGQASGAGTGIVLNSTGLVLTNNHVVDGATTLSATDLGNGQTYDATVVGYDVKDDVAVIQLTGATGLTTATIGSPATVGEAVYAVGNAGGTGGTPTVTTGTISGTGKSVTATDNFNSTSETLSGMLQTTAALISGDSGGALTTSSGTVVGVDTAGSSAGGQTGGGFAIPIATALGIAHEITSGLASDRVHVGPTALLGVEVRSSTATTGGAPVGSVLAGTPAAGAGLTAGSFVTSVGGHPVADGADLRTTMATLAPGSTATVTWVDAKGASHSATVTLASGPPQ